MAQSANEGADVVIASRYRSGSRVVGLSLWRRFMSLGARILFQTVFPILGVRDYTCGYRAYRARLLRQAFALYGDRFIEHAGFQCMADILLKLSRFNPVFREVPMILRYDRKGGASKMQVGTTVVNTLELVLQRRFERWTSVSQKESKHSGDTSHKRRQCGPDDSIGRGVSNRKRRAADGD